MSKSLEQVKNEMVQAGLADERKIAVFSNAKSLPGGEFGLVLLGINHGVLTVSDTDFSQEIGKKLYEIPLDQISDFKASSFVLRRYAMFTYKGFRYHFADFGDARNFIEALNAEASLS